MCVTEQYHLYQLAHHFVEKEKYQILHINNKIDEIWLEKQNRKVSTIIRFIHRGFDWKNHLKTDIATVFQRVKAMQRLFTGKDIVIYNIYITKHEPVDDWEMLKKPMILKEKKPVKMNVFYFSDVGYLSEESRFFEQIGLHKPMNDDVIPTEDTQNTFISTYKRQLNHLLVDKNAKAEKVFSYGKPRFVYAFIVLNILMFLALEFNGGSTDIQTLIKSGAKYNPAIINGEWWRIITSMFIHIGALHLFMNMLALYYLGMVVEKIYGSIRFILIYFLAGIGGGLTSFAFNTTISAGASGALFGLFGALLYFGIMQRRLFQQTMGMNIIIILFINLLIGLIVPQIDMGAHLGGLLAGFIAAVITSLPDKRLILLQSIAIIGYVCMVIFLVTYGVWMNLPH